jgi:hypothetical protein
MGYEKVVSWGIAKAADIGSAIFGPKWPETGGGVFGGIAFVIGGACEVYPELASQGSAHAVVVTSAVVCAVFWSAACAFALGRRQWAAPERQAKKLMNKLHQEWFPGNDGDIDRDYRLSFWTPHPSPEQPREWRCMHRTLKPTEKKWPHVTDPERLIYGGIVAFSANKHAGQNVDGVPEDRRSDTLEKERYRARAKLSSERHAELSWKYAALRTTIVRSDSGATSGILLVERKCGQPIPLHLAGRAYWTKIGEGYEPVDVLSAELGLVANVWAATISPPEGKP